MLQDHPTLAHLRRKGGRTRHANHLQAKFCAESMLSSGRVFKFNRDSGLKRMKHAVIAAHPNLSSLTLSVARAYCEAVGRSGGEVLLRDLYRMNFAPCLEAAEIPGAGGFTP